jgi:hypothetical protein
VIYCFITGVCAAAAFGGHVDVLKWMQKEGLLWDEKLCQHAAGYVNHSIYAVSQISQVNVIVLELTKFSVTSVAEVRRVSAVLVSVSVTVQCSAVL